MTATAMETVGGVHAAVLTPFDADGQPDASALARHGRWLLANGCDGLAILGTTGEANSFSVDERLRLLDGLAEAGLPGDRLIPGTGCCAFPDTVALTRQAVEIGAAAVLMLPPFYYKGASDDGLFAAYADVIERVGDDRLRIVVYHFPQMSGVPLSIDLIGRLRQRYPEIVIGIKDSSGDLDGMIRCAEAFPGFAVLSGSDELLWPLLQAGGAGCITGVANVAAWLAAEILAAWRQGDRAAAEHTHARLTAIRRAIAAYPLTAACKEVMARHTGDAGWRRVRPPLMPLPADAARALADALDGLGFRPPAVERTSDAAVSA